MKSPGSEILNFGPISIRWYGLLIAISVYIGLYLSNYLAKKRNLPNGTFNDLLPFLILSSIIGARLYYVIFEWEMYSGNRFWSSLNILGLNFKIPSFLEIWGGGIAIHGAIIAGGFSVFIFSRLRSLNFGIVIDSLIPSVALGQSIGRWGNFFNNEAFGIPTDLPWKLYIPVIKRPLVYFDQDYFHPTFLYESIWNFLIFGILIYLFKLALNRRINLPNGALSFFYLILYGAGRFWIEWLRIDPLCINSSPPFCYGGIRVAQLVSIVFLVIGISGLIWTFKKCKSTFINKIKLNKKS